MNTNDPLGASATFSPRVTGSSAPSNTPNSPRLDSSNSSQRQRWQQVMEQSQCRDWFKAPPSANPALLTRSASANPAPRAEALTPPSAGTAFDSQAQAHLDHPRTASLQNQSTATSPTRLGHPNGWSARNAGSNQPQPQRPSSATSAPRTAYLAAHAQSAALNPQATATATALTDDRVSALLAQVMRGNGDIATGHDANMVQVSWHWSSSALAPLDSVAGASTGNRIEEALDAIGKGRRGNPKAIAVWLGVPLARQPEIPRLTQQLQTALQSANVALASLVCNGERLFPLDQPES